MNAAAPKLNSVKPSGVSSDSRSLPKGKKVKNQRLRGNPADTEPVIEVHVRRVVDVTIGNCAALGEGVPAPTPPHTGTTANRICGNRYKLLPKVASPSHMDKWDKAL